ncbi:hypothetical protein [Limosilactobacillus oris]|uniref:hypothetical protein n=1 Tax=Limosilactobacillus oris TaxID=1632 RepID=UPI001884141D|nr:hypothetical protein [Limosilactobacillus oris]MBF0601905.1 hypothetical protein [Limosilactobacillus oris]
MAQRRMLNIDLILDDRFTQDLSPEAQNMYVYLNMLADDDGIVGHLKRQLRMLGKDPKHVEKLLNSGYLLRFDNETIVITDWLVNNHIRGDRYTESREDDCRAALYITYDWRYSLNKDDKRVFTSYAEWIANKRKVNGQQLGQISREELKQLAERLHQKSPHNYPVTDRKPSGNHPSPPVPGAGAVSGAGTVSGAGSVAGTGLGAVEGTGKGSDKECVYTTTSSSNGGMGEKSSYLHDEVEIEDGNFITQINQIMGTKIPENDERLTTLFNDATDNYKDTYIKKGLAKLLTAIQGVKLPDNQVKQLVTDHLSENIKKVTTGEESH